MATSSSLSHLLHANPVAASQSQPPSQSQHQHQHQHQQQVQQHGEQLRHPQPHPQHQQPPPSSSQLSITANAPSTIAPINAPAYNYPAPPSSVSPAPSGTSNSLATPATSPTATSAPASVNGSAVSRGHAANTSLYQCADCLKRYSRPEHLQRHIATHTLGKRFVCDVSTRGTTRDNFAC